MSKGRAFAFTVASKNDQIAAEIVVWYLVSMMSLMTGFNSVGMRPEVFVERSFETVCSVTGKGSVPVRAM